MIRFCLRVGLFGQVLVSARLLVQRLASERGKRSIMHPSVLVVQPLGRGGTAAQS